LPRTTVVAGVAVVAMTAPAVAAPTPTPDPPTPPPVETTEPKKKRVKKKTVERVRVSVTPSEGKFGVGQLITARFSAPVRFKKKAEAGMVITSKQPLPKGAWGWINSTTAVYRPKAFWPGRTRIKVRLNLRKVRLNADATTKWVGAPSTTRVASWRTARSWVARINADTHQMRVYRNGVLVKVFGVSLGKAGFLTRSGVKVVTGEKYRWTRMTSAGIGLTDEFYDLNVPYAVRITPTGEFVHGAPWAVSRIGRWNGSHGCTNLNVSDARWFYNNVQPGDVTVTVKTGRPMETWNGTPGSYWNYTWKQWRAMSALS
jgi:lipoprotein-anchoring transpeptidase ErfK/SrfK